MTTNQATSQVFSSGSSDPKGPSYLQVEAPEKGASLWKDSFYRLKRNKLALAGLAYLIMTAMVAFLAPWITSFSYEETDLMLGAVPHFTIVKILIRKRRIKY